MEIVNGIIAGIFGTLVMTLFIAAASVFTGYNFRVPAILGSMAIFQISPSGRPSRSFTSLMIGNIHWEQNTPMNNPKNLQGLLLPLSTSKFPRLPVWNVALQIEKEKRTLIFCKTGPAPLLLLLNRSAQNPA